MAYKLVSDVATAEDKSLLASAASSITGLFDADVVGFEKNEAYWLLAYGAVGGYVYGHRRGTAGGNIMPWKA